MMTIPVRVRLIVSSLLLLAVASCKSNGGDDPVVPPVVNPPVAVPSQVAAWVTNTDRSSLFAKQLTALNFATGTNSNPTIVVDTTQTYQSIDGFGYCLTGGSAQVINAMSAPERAKLLRELFATDSTWIGTSYLRVSIGASDLDAQVFSYNDLPGGQTDPTMAQFSLAPDRTNLIPVLKEILAINPAIKILGSPWSAPTWMKSNNSTVGGTLRPQYYDAYARYFVKYIQGMAAEGITIDAITLQNEPLNPNNNPSMVMSAAEQATFIKNNVGPALAAANLRTKIIAYDHNADRPDYPLDVLNDAAARPYVDGSAFHLYGGSITALTQVHNAYPTKNIYFTEQYTDAGSSFGSEVPKAVNDLVIGATRNWSRNVLQWNLAADQNNNPHTPGGCTVCLPAVTVNGNNVFRNAAYYTIAHASKFVRPGSVRIDTNVPGNLPNVAFKTPSGKKVLIVLNTSGSPLTFNIQYKGKIASPLLYGNSVGTYVW